MEDDELGPEERGCSWLFGETDGCRDRVVVAMDWPVRGEILVALCDAHGGGQDATEWASKELVGLLETADFAAQSQTAVEQTFWRLHVQIAERRSGGTSGLVLVHLSPTRVVTACVGSGRAAFVGGNALRMVAKDTRPERSLGDVQYPPNGCVPDVVVTDRSFGHRSLLVATADVWEALARGETDFLSEPDVGVVRDRLAAALDGQKTGVAIFVALRQGPTD